MWFQIGGLVVAFLGVAVSANWLAEGHVRRLGTIRARAELVALLPEGDARSALIENVEADVTRYLRLLKYSELFRLRHLILFSASVAAVLATTATAILVISLAGSEPGWADAVLWSALGGVALAVTVSVGAARMLRVRWDDHFPDNPWEQLGV